MKNIDKYNLREKLTNFINENTCVYIAPDGEYAFALCEEKPCSECIFYKMSCKNTVSWLFAEKIDRKLMVKEKAILQMLKDHDYKWLTRDNDKELYASINKPKKYYSYWDDGTSDEVVKIQRVFDTFEFVKWENEEPWNIDYLLEENEE